MQRVSVIVATLPVGEAPFSLLAALGYSLMNNGAVLLMIKKSDYSELDTTVIKLPQGLPCSERVCQDMWNCGKAVPYGFFRVEVDASQQAHI